MSSGVTAPVIINDQVVNLLPLCFDGHGLYLRRCLMGEEDPDNPGMRIIDGGIAICEKTADYTLWFEVRGIGPRVGEPRNKTRAWHESWRNRGFPIPCQQGQSYEDGDLVFLPQKHPLIDCSPFDPDNELVCDESVPIMKGEYA